MLLTADWVVPISRRPIPDGAVVVRGDSIAAVGPAAALAEEWAGDEVFDLCGRVLMPGLVNAHTHLGLSAMAGLFAPSPFTDWLPRIVAAMREWSSEDYAASTAAGAAACLKAGTTSVGDIVYGTSSMVSAARIGLGGVFFFEVLGITPAELPKRLRELGFAPGPYSGDRVAVGLSPHTVYSSGPSLLQAVSRLAREGGVPVCLHVAETLAEIDLVRDGTGPLAPVAAKLAHGFRPTGETPVAYLGRLGVLDGITAVHLCHVSPNDVDLLARHARGAVTCPRSNKWLHNGIAPVDQLLAAGLPVGLGTDSLASTPDLDLFAEARALREQFALDAHTLLELLTVQGARALGIDHRLGMLENGMQADLVAFRVAETRDPESALLESAGAATVDAVITGGEWRVRGGAFLADVSADEAAAEQARSRARWALS